MMNFNNDKKRRIVAGVICGILVIAMIAFQRLSGSPINFVTIRATFRLREPMRRAFMEKRARLRVPGESIA